MNIHIDSPTINMKSANAVSLHENVLAEYALKGFLDFAHTNPTQYPELIGKGGLATVFRIGDYVAKVNPITTDNQRVFMRNNMYASALLRPHVETINADPNNAAIQVAIHYAKYKDATGIQYIVSIEPFLNGRTLSEKLTERTDMVIDVLRKIKNTLRYLFLHADGFTHNDLHTENVFITEREQRPCIIDFDWATFERNKDYTTRYLPALQSTFKKQCNMNSVIPGPHWYLVHQTSSIITGRSLSNTVDLTMLIMFITLRICSKDVHKCHDIHHPEFVDILNYV